MQVLTNRKNVIIIADEAHRSQYGLEVSGRHKKQEKSNTAMPPMCILCQMPTIGFMWYTFIDLYIRFVQHKDLIAP